ncbi:MAG TPA: sodium:proton antiporter [Verrucomicrobiae bacterium]|nr:sodium:proton antiporter [Verrucomicrobiae bacterium]
MDASTIPASIPPALLAPFVLLLALIALGPLWFPGWWGRHYPKVACGLALFVALWYGFGLHMGHRVLETAHEYFSFIALIGSLFVVSGGIHITVKGEATPRANVLFLLIGAVAANLLGTTGASMLLIRPWIRLNKYRITAHHVVFFIFIVSNVGGCLTPIGDPPLFLGYLMGVPFWWTASRCLPAWGVGVALLLAMFYFVDRKNFARASAAVREKETASEHWKFEGLKNLFFLAVILASTAVKNPPFLREALMIAAALGSYFTTPKPIHESNHFHMDPVKEVAILFIGIFGTMIPALDWLQANASLLQSPAPAFFYFGSGTLSSVLDNAPTYLCFLKAVFGRFVAPNLAGTPGGLTDQMQVAYIIASPKLATYLVAVSVGSVFFGANTYIGNGPNFMVKSIADHQKVHTPSFLVYIWKFTLPFMLPMLLVVWLLFFKS